jgi:hypothetical protein
MRFRKLRITWSIVCGLACVLLIVLWVRSYKTCDIFCLRLGGPHNQWIQSLDGELMYDPSANLSQSEFFKWIIWPAAKWRGYVKTPLTRPVLGFRRSIGIKSLAIIPHWFPTVVLAGIAVLPWLGWPRFRLRTLLIATTLIAVVLGLAVYAARK